jgi:acetyl/propionyl-CoA carboxylase alpha subunit
MRRALREFLVKGIKTSIPFHELVMKHPKFLEGHYDTGFIETHLGGSLVSEPDPEAERVAHTMAAIAAFRAQKDKAARAAASVSGGGPDAGARWKDAGRRSQMRGGLR